jgi:hypothetical protein
MVRGNKNTKIDYVIIIINIIIIVASEHPGLLSGVY